MSFNLFSLKGKNVLITGASRGIGRACAVALAEAGANICLVLRPSSSSSDTSRTSTEGALRATGVKVTVVQCNLDDLEAVKQVFPKALELMDGNIHILVNCAGIQRRAPAVQFSEKDWDDVSKRC
jgi:2-dehydro-3-deoxy-D-gluconate 5-dehydrogenase